MRGHYITWTISPDSYRLDVTIECREPAEADCRSVCAGQCEYWAHCDRHTDRCPRLVDHCLYCREPIRTGQECNALLFMDGDYIECYDGPENGPIRDGLVEVEWDNEDDGYTWHYPEPDAAQLAVTQ